jgi:hypothetical protein
MSVKGLRGFMKQFPCVDAEFFERVSGKVRAGKEAGDTLGESSQSGYYVETRTQVVKLAEQKGGEVRCLVR